MATSAAVPAFHGVASRLSSCHKFQSAAAFGKSGHSRSPSARPRRVSCAKFVSSASTSPVRRTVWIETSNVQVLVAALEVGLTHTVLFAGSNVSLAEQWRAVGRFETMRLDEKTGVVYAAGGEGDGWNKKTSSRSEHAIGVVCPVETPGDVTEIGKLVGVEPLVIVDCGREGYGDHEDEFGEVTRERGGNGNNSPQKKKKGWKMIPAENLVAAFGRSADSRVMAFADSFAESVVFFEALGVGVDGVVLRTRDPGQVRKLQRYLDGDSSSGDGDETETRGDTSDTSDAPSTSRQTNRPANPSSNPSKEKIALVPAVVTKVTVVGVGDRVCVDCTSNFEPGQGLLVGSFARGLFLAHSECLDSFGYVNQRPFRVNAGPVCAYVLLPNGLTGYLSELRTGDEVLCVSADGTYGTKTVGRVKIERRQMVLVEAAFADAECEETDGMDDGFDGEFDGDDNDDDDASGFADDASGLSSESSPQASEDDVCVTAPDVHKKKATSYSVLLQNAETVRLVTDGSRTAVSVSAMKVGDSVLVHRLNGARHTGIAISEAGWEER